MPKRKDINKILIIGSGPIVIGQAAEFDYSGTQAIKALKKEGYKIIVVNSNPATIMTDPEIADRTYIEPLTADFVEKIIKKERPDALLSTLGGQTALNISSELWESGVLNQYSVELIGAKYETIKKAEDREEFRKSIEKIGLEVPKSFFVDSPDKIQEAIRKVGVPCVIRPSYTLGGTGGGIAWTEEEYYEKINFALRISPKGSAIVEEYLDGWKEYELEVMRDKNDNFSVVCTVENLDPMGVHTGDSITVAPAQTLTDKEYQAMRDAAKRIMIEIGVDTGGSNIQFAVNPKNGRMVVIEMNPRVSRSSALVSKATGFPIAKIAALLAVGYTLDEIPNFITQKTPASFEPSIDYVVVKIPRFDFEKFPEVDPFLGTQMKSIGEVMAIGRTFREALLKAIESIEKKPSFPEHLKKLTQSEIENYLKPHPMRIFVIFELLRRGETPEKISEKTRIDPWFIRQMKKIVEIEKKIQTAKFDELRPELLKEAKENGFSDKYIAYLLGKSEDEVRRIRYEKSIKPSFKCVDTCAGEFEAYTPYYYSTYDYENESYVVSGKKKGVIIGAGPNRIGQGIEFDYSSVHAIDVLKELGYYSIMINSNPETVSTDYDVSDRLYFEPLSFERVIDILHHEKPDLVFVSFGGQTPLNIAKKIASEGFNIAGTPPDSIDIAEDREKFRELLENLGIKQPKSDIAFSLEEAKEKARKIGYPVLIRPSFVLGGRAMSIVGNESELEFYILSAIEASPGQPILIDKFMEGTIEVDVDLVCDGKDVLFGGILRHIEPAGIHSGDSANIIPANDLPRKIKGDIVDITYTISRWLGIEGIANFQLIIHDGDVYVLEANPRASRTVPFISKSIGIPLAKVATKVMCGYTLKDIGIRGYMESKFFSVKEVVLPFLKLRHDPVLGPEMRSTGEVMGIDFSPFIAFYKSQLASGNKIPISGSVLFTVRDKDKEEAYKIAYEFEKLGFRIFATAGTYEYFRRKGINCTVVRKLGEGKPDIVDIIESRKIDLLVNTFDFDRKAISDSGYIRKSALFSGICYFTTIEAAKFAMLSIKEIREKLNGDISRINVYSLQELYSIEKNYDVI
ncbi:MAG: carbamoyl-phosphate synthase large subunit [Candidatus Calescibacterium sp.]|nr:carbamoyl-phosphate synthase large subunit [Candidatus Calescibacterium sp.]MCX7734277.1 carbamoyl-phosphate synthase large subunit [bacterium]MDW8087108.1 carbamoyl-phosphate synthase large subunit [Candidatus Calescibacterium sp.]